MKIIRSESYQWFSLVLRLQTALPVLQSLIFDWVRFYFYSWEKVTTAKPEVRNVARWRHYLIWDVNALFVLYSCYVPNQWRQKCIENVNLVRNINCTFLQIIRMRVNSRKKEIHTNNYDRRLHNDLTAKPQTAHTLMSSPDECGQPQWYLSTNKKITKLKIAGNIELCGHDVP